MRFTPKTEQEISHGRLLPKGEYDFEIASAEDTVSKKSGADMIKLRVKLYDGGESPACSVFDYLMEKLDYKLRHAAYACGASEKYEAGELCAADLDGKTGKCFVDIDKDKTGQYSDKNTIRDYIVPDGAGGNDDLPF